MSDPLGKLFGLDFVASDAVPPNSLYLLRRGKSVDVTTPDGNTRRVEVEPPTVTAITNIGTPPPLLKASIPMANKVWTDEQREAACKLIAEKRRTPKAWPFATDEVVNLQCELTAKDAELTEAVELMQRATYRLKRTGQSDNIRFSTELDEFLKRNTGGA